MKTKQLPQGWKEIELGETFEIKKGKSITRDLVTTGNVPVIAGGQNPAYYHNESNRKGETITVSGSGAYAGFVNFFNQPIFASDCSTLQAINNNEVSGKYGFYFLKSIQNKIYGLQKGIAQPHVYPKDLILIKIPLPPISIQKKIVKILEQAEELKNLRKQGNELTDDYLKSIFAEMFLKKNKFEEVRLEEISELITKGTTPTTYGYKYQSKGIPFLKVENINGGRINLKVNSRFINKETHEFLKRSQLKKNDVLFTIAGAIGRSAVITTDLEMNTNQAVALIRLKKEISPIFISSLLDSPFIMKQIKGAIVQVAQANLSLTQVRKIKIPLPPLPLQKKFSSIVEKVEKIKEHQKQSEEEINNLFNALMQRAFRGELT